MEPIKQPRSGTHKKGRSNQFTQPTKNKYPKDYSRCSFALAIAAAPAGRNVTGLLKIHPLNVAVADPMLLPNQPRTKILRIILDRMPAPRRPALRGKPVDPAKKQMEVAACARAGARAPAARWRYGLRRWQCALLPRFQAALAAIGVAARRARIMV